MHSSSTEERCIDMERINWNDLWRSNLKNTCHESDKEFWDDFAPRFRKDIPEDKDPYVEQFYRLSEFRDGETIFDMGCGSGILAIPFAKRGHEIWAADFSDGMLEYLMKGAECDGVAHRIHPIKLDWNEDWSRREDLPVCDVAISSRSFIVKDLTDGLKKLESRARDRVCAGTWDTPAPSSVGELAKPIGYERPGYGCYVYIMGELMDRDMRPSLQWIKNPFRRSSYESVEDAIEKLKKSFCFGLSKDQEKAMEDYCRLHLKQRDKDGRKVWKMDTDETSTIAHIMWNVG